VALTASGVDGLEGRAVVVCVDLSVFDELALRNASLEFLHSHEVIVDAIDLDKECRRWREIRYISNGGRASGDHVCVVSRMYWGHSFEVMVQCYVVQAVVAAMTRLAP